MLPTAVLWIDPGGMSGLAMLAKGEFVADEFEFLPACQQIHTLCHQFGDQLWVGWERFRVHANTHKLTPQPEAPEVIGVARYFATSYGCRILTPAAPGDRNAATPEKLHAIGWWVPGKDDAQSAAQHLLAWLMRTNQVPPAQLAVLSPARGGQTIDG